jgi:hypothetical protein
MAGAKREYSGGQNHHFNATPCRSRIPCNVWSNHAKWLPRITIRGQARTNPPFGTTVPREIPRSALQRHDVAARRETERTDAEAHERRDDDIHERAAERVQLERVVEVSGHVLRSSRRVHRGRPVLGRRDSPAGTAWVALETSDLVRRVPQSPPSGGRSTSRYGVRTGREELDRILR